MSCFVVICYWSQSSDGSTRIWDVRTGQCEIKFTNQEAGVNGVRFHPSGESVAAAGNDGGVSGVYASGKNRGVGVDWSG